MPHRATRAREPLSAVDAVAALGNIARVADDLANDDRTVFGYYLALDERKVEQDRGRRHCDLAFRVEFASQASKCFWANNGVGVEQRYYLWFDEVHAELVANEIGEAFIVGRESLVGFVLDDVDVRQTFDCGEAVVARSIVDDHHVDLPRPL